MSKVKKVKEGGYHNRFVNEDQIMDMLVCKICQAVSRDPHETKCCNNTFCKSCIDKAYIQCKQKCPICRSFLETAEAVQICRRIKQLDVYCEYENDGCQWIGQVEAINKHLKDECSYKPILCEYHIVGCKTKIIHGLQVEHNQKDMKNHFKLVSDCVKKLKDTEQQLKDTEQQLKYSEDKLTEHEDKLIKYNTRHNDDNVKLKNANARLAYTKKDLATAENDGYESTKRFIIFLVISWCIVLMVVVISIIYPSLMKEMFLTLVNKKK